MKSTASRIGFVWAALILAPLAGCSDRESAESQPSMDEITLSAEIAQERRLRVTALSESWPDMPAYNASFNALDPGVDTAQAMEASLFNPNEVHWGLPDSAGRQIVENFCAACHSLRLVMQQNLSREGWDESLTQMVETRGMPELLPDSRESVLAYLTLHFGPKT